MYILKFNSKFNKIRKEEKFMCIKASNVTVELTDREIEVIKKSLLSRLDYLSSFTKIYKTGSKDLDFILNNHKEVSKKHIAEINDILSNKLSNKQNLKRIY